MKRTMIVSLAAVLSLFATAVFAADPSPPTDAAPAATRPTTGRALMTPEERVEHRARMRAAKTPEERRQLRAEEHERMKQRAREEGKTIPDAPPMGGMGQGGGMGPK